MKRVLEKLDIPPGKSHKQAVPLVQPQANAPNATTVFVLLFLLYMFDYVDRLVVTSLFPFLKSDLGINDAQAGLLVSAVYWSIVALTFPVSVLIDRWSRKKSIGLMVGLWSLATGAAALTRTFPQLLITRLGVGAGEAGYSPGGTAMISALYPVEKRSRMLGLWNASIPLGSAIGVAVGGIVATRWGWHRAFGLVAAPGLVVGILFYFLARDYKTVKLEVPAWGRAAVRRMRAAEMLQEFLRKPSLLLTYLGFVGNAFLSSAYLTWLPSYFNRTSGIPMAQAGLKSSVVLLFSIVGAPLGGLLVDRWRRNRGDARPLFAGLASIAAAIVWLTAFGFLQGTSQYVVFMLGAVLSALYISGAAAATQDAVHPGLWAVSWSICVIVQNLLGSSLGPLVVGAISDTYGLRTAMMLVPVASVIAGVFFLAASRFYERDLMHTRKVQIALEKA
ncbi:MAG TPA: MFS transporter [Spirochaetia bacterium]|nr:MFS transporter [Spirochaetia bacterium]